MSTGPSIDTKPDGPYVVTGSVPLRTKQPVVSEHGEPLTWQTNDVLDAATAYALCRCGASANKPYCDGSHTDNGFDGTETASAKTYIETRVSLGGEGVEIFDDRAICTHAGFCGNRLTNIWEMAAKTGDTQVRAQAMAMVERCPSGALAYAVDNTDIEPDFPTEISVIPNGPLWVTGKIPIGRADGEPMEARNRVTLCRCGGSANKPLCDGTHTDNGFEG